jgi:hypothetical protein
LTEPQISSENGGQSSKLRRRCCTPTPQTWQARTSRWQRPTAAPARAGSRVRVAAGRAYWRQDDSRLAGGGGPNAPPRSGETGGKGCRLSGRRGTRADGMGIGNPKRGRAGCQIRSPAARPGASSPIPPDTAGRSPEIGRLNLWVGGSAFNGSDSPSAGEQAARAQAQARPPTRPGVQATQCGARANVRTDR